MSVATAQESRKHKRIQKSCEVEFSSDNETYRGATDNFSIDGLFIRTDNLCAPHSVISIRVYLPDGSASIVKGTVRQVVKMCNDTGMEESQQPFKGGMGIEIMERDPHYINFFMSLLSGIKF